MPEPSKVDAPKGPALVVIPVAGLAKNGKPFLGINMVNHENEKRPHILNQGVLGLIATANDEQLRDFREAAKKALLWRMTHRAVYDEANDVVKAVKQTGPAKADGKRTFGDAF